MKNYSYTGINAHKKYSRFSLEEYIEQNFELIDKKVLDMGCGDGNMTGVLSNEVSLYVGLEKNRDLLKQAYQKFKGKKETFFVYANMDKSFCFPYGTFDFIFFIFSSYYSNDAECLFKKCHDLLQKDGEVVVIGPTSSNAWEIDDFCFEMFGKSQPASLRAERIEGEFIPIFQKIFRRQKMKIVDFSLLFPDFDSYVEYVEATLQYRESYNGVIDKKKAKKLLIHKYKLSLSKEVVILCGRK